MLQIPWTDSEDFQFEVSLDRTVYLLRLRWNDVAQSYAMDLLTRNRVPILLGARLCSGTSIAQSTTADGPPGRFYVLGENPTRARLLSGACTFVYLSPEEFPDV